MAKYSICHRSTRRGVRMKKPKCLRKTGQTVGVAQHYGQEQVTHLNQNVGTLSHRIHSL